jgi:DNA end-binding protein Ku
LINQHRKGKAPEVETEEEERPKGDNVIDLMAALKRSLEGGPKAGRKSAAPAARTRGRGRTTARPAKSRARKAPARKATRKSA